MFKTPILFIVFNRPDVTQIVFNILKELKPKYLYVSADGPRKNKADDFELCKKTRDVISQINWECEIKTLYRTENLGCGLAVSGAISWFFNHVNKGIILEDDCLPNISFFKYCELLLNLYENNEKIMHIGGTNFQNGKIWGNEEYYFSKLAHVWGWATWKRAWDLYDYNIKPFYLFVRENKINNYYSNKKIAQFCLENFKKAYHHKIDTWDYQWTFTILNNNGVAVIPNTNLVSNIGFREDATHTTESHEFANISNNEINLLNIRYIDSIEINENADNNFYYNFYLKK